MVSSEVNSDSRLLNGIRVSYNKRNNYIVVAKTSEDPQSAFDGVSVFSNSLNRVLKLREMEKVQASINALKGQENVASTKTKEYLDELLAQQLYKEALLASSHTKLVTQINEAVKPTSHIKPKRALIVILGTLLGIGVGVTIALIRFAFRRDEK